MHHQLLQIPLSCTHTHTPCGTTTAITITTTIAIAMIGKEYVCVLRLHSAIESETQLAKVTLNALIVYTANNSIPSFFCIPPSGP